MAKDGIDARLAGIKLDLDLEGAYGRALIVDNGEGAGGEGAVEEDLSGERQLDRSRGICDIVALEMLRERVEGLAGHEQTVSGSIDVLHLDGATHVGKLDGVEEEQRANDGQDDAGELSAADAATVLALGLARALAASE